MVVFLVDLEMLSQFINPLTEKCDLHFRRPRILIVQPKIVDDFDFLFLCETHINQISCENAPLNMFVESSTVAKTLVEEQGSGSRRTAKYESLRQRVSEFCVCPEPTPSSVLGDGSSDKSASSLPVPRVYTSESSKGWCGPAIPGYCAGRLLD